MTDAHDREAAFIALYQKVFPAVCRYISKKGGTLDDAKDIFQDSIIIFYEKILVTSAPRANEKAYVMGIAKHLWLKNFNARPIILQDEKELHNLAVNEQEEPAQAKLLFYLESAGKKCMELLKAFYYDQLTVQSVARLFGYSGLHSASVQKYKCLEKVRNEVQQKALHYEDFIE